MFLRQSSKKKGTGNFAAPRPCRHRLSRLTAAVSREQLHEDSAPSDRSFDSTRAGVCVRLKRGLRTAVRSCEARSPRHTGPRFFCCREVEAPAPAPSRCRSIRWLVELGLKTKKS